ncbi:hypothetical protein ACWC10_06045 [Streptomyces sp. NPDC001595]|uniref:hypothetical protein n=1 Tax=Streptomyces sp. NPDC001532 TaxID=3154520 RepID=UPI00331718E9
MTTRTRLRAAVLAHPVLTVAIAGTCLAALGGVGEMAARKVVADRIRAESNLVGAEAAVQQRGGWALTALTGERLPEVGIASDNATLGPFKGVSLQVDVYGLVLGSPTEFEHVHGLAIVDEDALRDAFNTARPGMSVTSVELNRNENIVSVTFDAAGRSEQVELIPETDGLGGFSFVRVDGETSEEPGQGSGLDRLSSVINPSTGPAKALGLRFQAAAVFRDGLHLVLDRGAGQMQ